MALVLRNQAVWVHPFMTLVVYMAQVLCFSNVAGYTDNLSMTGITLSGRAVLLRGRVLRYKRLPT
jgi:hypothetical protein